MDQHIPRPLRSADPRIVHQTLRDEARPDPLSGRMPDPKSGETKRLFEYWLAPNVFVCQMGTEVCCPSYCGKSTNRCGNAYWRQHSALVARMMQNLAIERGASPPIQEAWRGAGLLHDLDYLRAPHDQPGHPADESHPVPLVLDLCDLGAPPAVTLAILEHSPHLDLGISSSLSAALIGCDEAASLYAFGQDLVAGDGVPEPVIAALPHKAHRVPAEGKLRANIRERMAAAFQRAAQPEATFDVALP